MGFPRLATAPATATSATVSTATATSSSAVVVLLVAVLLAILGLPVGVLLRQLGLLLLMLLMLDLLLGNGALGELRLLSGRGGVPRKVRDGARDGLGVLVDVEALVDAGGDGLNLSAEVALDVVKVEAIVPVNEVDGQTQVAVTTRSTDSVQVGFGILGEVEVDDDIDGLDIDTTGEQIGADQVSADAVSEIVEDSVTGLLLHSSVTVEARVAELGDLLGQQLDSVGGVAEDDGLVDLELGEKGVQAVDLLLFLDESVVLGDTAQGELVHEVDLVGAGHVAVGEVLDREGEGGGEEHDLAILGVELKELLDDRGELDGQQLVGLIHDEHRALAQVGHILARQIEDTARGTNDDVDRVLETDNIIAQTGTTGGDHDVDAEVLAEGLADLGSLHGQLTCGDKDKTLDLGDFGVDALKCRDNEGGRLAGTILCARQDVSTGQCDGKSFFLNGGGLLETGLEDAHEQVSLQSEVFEF